MTSKAQISCKVIEATFCIKFLFSVTMVFGQKMGKILVAPSFRIKFDDVTVTLSLIILS